VDKLRALHYFVAAADSSSFSGAARRLGVSVAAVAKLVGTLERELGIKLFERHASGLALTASGSHYLEACRPALQQLGAADEQASAARSSARGTVVVGVQPVIAQECLTVALPRFAALYPDIQLDLRYFMRPSEEQTRGVDAMLVMGWPQQVADLVQRRLGASSFAICAAPSYWAQHGMPQHPSELEQHNCLCVRSIAGTVMDLWHFARGDERVSVAARGSVVADNVHRDTVRELTIAGVGVSRILEWDTRRGRLLADGALQPALTDWRCTEVVPVNLLYPASVRHIPRVRLFIEFVTQLFIDIEGHREMRAPATGQPGWLKSRKLRASATRQPAR
jgi:LysR family transcriptional regulator, regulator for bpeEF and oprC